MEEVFDIYTRDGKYIGTEKKSVCHSDNHGFYHKPVWIWIINSKNQVLLQKRSHKKKLFPNLWASSSAGHVRTGETIIEGAVRETKEELGIETKEEDYIYMGEYICDNSWELGQSYMLKLDLETYKFKISEDEVDEIKWIDFENIEDILFSEECVNMDKQYKWFVINYFKKYFSKD